MIHSPKLLLADEPTGNLDSKAAKDVMDMLETINREQKTTMMLVTHDAVAASYCHRVVFIKDGRFYTEIHRGDNRQSFFQKIIDTLSLLGDMEMTFRQFAFRNVSRNKRLYTAYFLSSMFTVMVFLPFPSLPIIRCSAEIVCSRVRWLPFRCRNGLSMCFPFFRALLDERISAITEKGIRINDDARYDHPPAADDDFSGEYDYRVRSNY